MSNLKFIFFIQAYPFILTVVITVLKLFSMLKEHCIHWVVRMPFAYLAIDQRR